MNKIYRFLLIIFSFLNLIKVKFLGIKSANYFIIVDKHIDRRSLYYFGLKDCKSTFNLIRLSKLNFVIFINILKIPNFFCYSIIKEFCYDKFKESTFKSLIFKIFIFLKIKKLLLIDDKREMFFFSHLANRLNIKTLIYMHGRFSKNSPILKCTFFNTYLVWSKFFLNQLKQANGNYNQNNIKIIGNPYLINKKNVNDNDTQDEIKIKRCLILDEDFMKFNVFKKYLTNINKIDHIKFFLKKKITRQLPDDYVDFCIKKNIEIIDSKNNLSNIINKKKIDCIIASTSTGLLEGIFYNLVPIKIYSKNNAREKEFKEFINQELIFYADNVNKFIFLLKKKYLLKELRKKNQKLWGNNSFNKKKAKRFIKNFLN